MLRFNQLNGFAALALFRNLKEARTALILIEK